VIATDISSISIDAREFYVKRDDLIDTYLAGNKYRKLYTLLQTPSNKFDTIISYGGTQSNAMLAIAAMCKEKNWKFVYYTKPLSKVQKEQLCGNFISAVSLGMEPIEIKEELYRDFIASLRLNFNDRTYIVDQGGANSLAKNGIEVLADEIRAINLDIDAIATPSGTGTTAFYLALCLPEFKVYTTATVGNTAYLKEQMKALGEIPKNLIILESDKKYHFAKPYIEFLEVFNKLQKTGIIFDLIYAPKLWKCLLEQTKDKILYVHSGGVTGNVSMLERYKRKSYFNILED